MPNNTNNQNNNTSTQDAILEKLDALLTIALKREKALSDEKKERDRIKKRDEKEEKERKRDEERNKYLAKIYDSINKKTSAKYIAKEKGKDFLAYDVFGDKNKARARLARMKAKNKLNEKGYDGEKIYKFASSAVRAAAVSARSVYDIGKASAKTAIAMSKKTVKETTKMTSKAIEASNASIKASVDIATTAMKDPIDGLSSSISVIGSSMDSIGSKFGTIGAAIGKTFGGVMDVFNKFEGEALKAFSKVDDAARKMQKSFGLTESQTEQFRDTSLEAAEMVARRWGKTYEDMMKVQNSIIEKTGRNIVLGESDYNEYFGLSQVAGEENAAGLTTGLQEFNQDVSSVSDMYLEMYKNAQKVGVSIEKSTKDVLNNLKMANKYNFKEGSKSIMEMAVWANKTKFNMASIGNVIDKVSGGGVESSITSSAQLQVLGGQFANQSNPLSMLYESLEDPQALAKRVQKMVASMGKFDVETGETKLSGSDIRMLQTAGKALGMSPEEMNVMAKEATRRQKVSSELGEASGLTDEQKDLIASKAQWDKEAKQFYVTNIAGEKTYASDISSTNIGQFDLKPEMSNEDKLVDYAGKTFSQVDEIAKVVAGKSIKDAKLGETQQSLFQELIKTTKETMDTVYSSIGSEIGEINKSINEIMPEFVPLLTNIAEAIVPMIPKIMQLFQPLLKLIGDTLIPLFTELSGTMIEMANSVVPVIGQIVSILSPLTKMFMESLIPIVSNIASAIVPLVEKIKPIFEKILSTIAPLITNLINEIVPVISEILTQLEPIVSTLFDTIAPILNSIITTVTPILKEFFEIVGPSINESLKTVMEIIGEILDIIMPFATAIMEVIGPLLSSILDVVTPIVEILIDTLSPILNLMLSVIGPVLNFIGKILSTTLDMLSPFIKSISHIVDGISDGINSLIGFLRDKLSYIGDWIAKIYNFVAHPIKEAGNWLEGKLRSIFRMHDGIVTSGGVVQTDPRDEIIAAKSGGPFDLLFNDMYDKISDVYDKTDERNALNKTIVERSNVTNNSKPTIVKVSPIGENNSSVEVNDKKINISNNSNNRNIGGNINIPPINVNINGKLDLVSNGNSVDIMEMIKTNPLLIRKITEMVIEQIGSNINGGKTTMFRNRYTI